MERTLGDTKALEKSILVPSVQELAKNSNLVRVPDRYVRPDQGPLISAAPDDRDDSSDIQAPVINMESLAAGNEIELEKLHLACQEWGFFQLINHEVNSSLVEQFKLQTREFFNLSFEEKEKYWQTPTEVQGFGNALVVSEKQKLDWGDRFYLITLPKQQRNPHLFPMLPLPYRDTVDKYSAEMQNIAMTIFDYMAKALNTDIRIMRNIFDEGHQSIRMNYYPPCPQPENVIGLTPHSDAVALTILLQLNEMDGLQIEKDGKWILVKPLPHAFIVNVGDVLEILSNGIYRSVMHRAVVNASKERLSVATFHSPGNYKEIGPIPGLITQKSPAKFRRIRMLDYWKGLFARALNGKSYLDEMRVGENVERPV